MRCLSCDKKLKEKHLTWEVYDTPWDKKSKLLHFCSEECETYYLYEKGDFDYFECQTCNRTICEQNPAQGWHTQIRYIDNEEICLKCYQKELLTNGQPKEDFESGEVRGMFFDQKELEKAGFEKLKAGSYSDTTVKHYQKHALELIKQGKKVVTNYDRLGIGGGGYYTLWAK